MTDCQAQSTSEDSNAQLKRHINVESGKFTDSRPKHIQNTRLEGERQSQSPSGRLGSVTNWQTQSMARKTEQGQQARSPKEQAMKKGKQDRQGKRLER